MPTGSRIVIDACVAGAWSYTETYTSQADAVLKSLLLRTVKAIVPDRFEQEVLRLCQKKTDPSISTADAWLRFLEIVTSPIDMIPSSLLTERAWDMATSVSGLSTHDALYLAVAERESVELWSLDDKLLRAGNIIGIQCRDLRVIPFPY